MPQSAERLRVPLEDEHGDTASFGRRLRRAGDRPDRPGLRNCTPSLRRGLNWCSRAATWWGARQAGRGSPIAWRRNDGFPAKACLRGRLGNSGQGLIRLGARSAARPGDSTLRAHDPGVGLDFLGSNPTSQRPRASGSAPLADRERQPMRARHLLRPRTFRTRKTRHRRVDCDPSLTI